MLRVFLRNVTVCAWRGGIEHKVQGYFWPDCGDMRLSPSRRENQIEKRRREGASGTAWSAWLGQTMCPCELFESARLIVKLWHTRTSARTQCARPRRRREEVDTRVLGGDGDESRMMEAERRAMSEPSQSHLSEDVSCSPMNKKFHE